MTIRQEKPEDIPAVFELNLNAFGRENEARLIDHLRASDAFIPELSLVATQNNRIAGHILFTRIWIVDTEEKETESLALAPMAVSQELQRGGIGSRLITAGLMKARALGFSSVIVLGHEQYYPKFGFVPTSRWRIKAPFDVPENALMGIELREGALQNVSGTIRYPKEFESV